jgi:SnoaL-like domain
MSTTEETMAAIERFNDAFNQHDVDGLTKLMTDDVVFERHCCIESERVGEGQRVEALPMARALRVT